ncbi:hypothetical protein BD560DRAFT_426798 [Blakeslea trispora]|nr:hypothetical protein BD560DRAFT_426798 [Blakeslea trispora]
MPLTNEIMFIYQACRKLTNNVIELRNDVNSMKEELAEVKDIVSRRYNVTQSSVVANSSEQMSFSIEQTVENAPFYSKIPYPMPSQLQNSEQPFDSRVEYFIQYDRDTILEAKTETMASWKRTIFQTGSVAVDLMINDLELAKLDWADISYRNLADGFKKSCRKYLTIYLIQKRIPLDRCVDFWLEDELMKHYYQSKRQTKKRKIFQLNITFRLSTNLIYRSPKKLLLLSLRQVTPWMHNQILISMIAMKVVLHLNHQKDGKLFKSLQVFVIAFSYIIYV